MSWKLKCDVVVVMVVVMVVVVNQASVQASKDHLMYMPEGVLSPFPASVPPHYHQRGAVPEEVKAQLTEDQDDQNKTSTDTRSTGNTDEEGTVLTDKDEKGTSLSGEDLLPKSDECGKRSRKSYRVMFGEDAPLSAYPWIALLGYQDPSNPLWLCGGTLINERYVLSAGHCVHPVSTKKSQAGQLVKIRLGEHNLDTDPDCPTNFIDATHCAEPPVDYNPEKMMVHKDYDFTKLHNDISLIRLDRAVVVGHSIRPVCLPASGMSVGAFLGTRDAVVAGWGATENVTQSKILQRASIPYNNNEKCEKTYYMKLSESQLCFGGRGKQDSCYGDSGGPIMQAKNGTGQYTLLGVVSFGKQICGISGTPAVYTNVAFYRNWILEHIEP